VPTTARNDVDISDADRLPPLLRSIRPEIGREMRDFFSPRIERDGRRGRERRGGLADRDRARDAASHFRPTCERQAAHGSIREFDPSFLSPPLPLPPLLQRANKSIRYATLGAPAQSRVRKSVSSALLSLTSGVTLARLDERLARRSLRGTVYNRSGGRLGRCCRCQLTSRRMRKSRRSEDAELLLFLPRGESARLFLVDSVRRVNPALCRDPFASLT